ncbi:hypothetical protein CONCODRAFT_165287 [Conidiobolus coronatus NRRL 28638]|uniref:General stress protein FMN-binding split barrel domain-containing protein n=1 Tax=Conidiobolus coronatus (strain ATCC 28846 / CBS 209.66 / NRRL 28638) TaxID=796925 RepID=A0A137PJ82_CONC2|nr:hypothetical protein CONCODRAFT_165287 [Conidiobolus coronatus NRRL 28638]|eukprot:KXN75035.1 hypothetical protein CONCODRAFT_165287 [Conidiobolus coronatus NRRL 28638]
MSESSKDKGTQSSDTSKISEAGLSRVDDTHKKAEDITSEAKRRVKTSQDPINIDTQAQTQQQQKEYEKLWEHADDVESPSKSPSGNAEDQLPNKSLGTPPPEVEASKFEAPTINDKVKEFTKLIKDFNQATLVTTDSNNGQLKSRIMYVYDRIEEIQFYLLSKHDSDLISDINADPKVNLTFQQSERASANWCSISAVATVVTDHNIIEKLWNNSVRNWLKDLGDKRKDASKTDPRIVAILIEPKAIDYFLDNQSAFEKIKYAMYSQKPAKYGREATYHLTSDEIDCYAKVHSHLK